MNIIISTLHVRPRYNPSQEVYVSGLLGGMAGIMQPGMKIRVLVTLENRSLFNLEGFEEIVCPFIPSVARRMLWEQRTLPELLHKLGTDMFHGTGNAAIFNYGGRQAITVHLAVEFKVTGGMKHNFQVAYRKWVIGRSVRAADGVICASEYLRDGLFRVHRAQESKRERFHVVPMGIDHELYSPAPPDLSDDEKILRGFGVNEPYFFAYNDILGLKNVPRILKAWAEFRRSGAGRDRCSLVLMGDPAGEKFIARDLDALGPDREHVIFVGFVTRRELAALYRHARAMIFPSLAESFGLCIVESMSCGTPVLTGNVTAMPETAGGAALLVNPLETEEIQHGMELLYEDTPERAKLVDAGLERVKPLTWRNTAEKTIAVYRSIIES
jgi:glycosyltransferase involved in cell wall biosynthesis